MDVTVSKLNGGTSGDAREGRRTRGQWTESEAKAVLANWRASGRPISASRAEGGNLGLPDSSLVKTRTGELGRVNRLSGPTAGFARVRVVPESPFSSCNQ